MKKIKKNILSIFIFTILGPALLVFAQQRSDLQEDYATKRKGNDLMWCVTSLEELEKCRALADAVTTENQNNPNSFGSYFRKILCKRYTSKDECMKLIDTGSLSNPNIMTGDAGEMFEAGRYHSLVPIIREVYENNKDFVHSLAVVKRNDLLNVRTMFDLKGLKACFPRVGSLAGWTIPIYRLIKKKVMPVVDCNNHVKSAIEFFGTSCAIDSINKDRYNPLGDNPHKFCELCGTGEPGKRCTIYDPFAGFTGALTCLQQEDKGQIAFLNERTLEQFVGNKDDFELLCPNMENIDNVDDIYLKRMPVDSYRECFWGVAPGNAVLVSSAMDMSERLFLQEFLERIRQIFGGPKPVPISGSTQFNSDYDNNNGVDPFANDAQQEEQQQTPFNLFESNGMLKNLLFDDNTKGFIPIKQNDMNYKVLLERNYTSYNNYPIGTPQDAINGIRDCPVGAMKLCVTSPAEMLKCNRMKTALDAQLINPKMTCVRSEHATGCMKNIASLSGNADVTVLEAGDIYKAGWKYNLIPFMAEVYNIGKDDQGLPFSYAVAVTKQRNNHSELIYLKRGRTCHPAVGHGTGWVMPMAWLLTNERVRDYGCHSLRAAAEYFNEACAPGARSAEYQDRNEPDYWEHSHMCDLCHGSGGHLCRRNHMEDYFGHTGAFRCLVEGGGDVAFIKHTTVMENTDGKRKEWWARNQLTTDYELLCRDGTRAPARNYESCYLGRVPANAIVTRKDISDDKIKAFINLFKYAQQFYGQKVPDEFSFSMYHSHTPFADLIFQDATQQLLELPEDKRDYTKYLDSEFLKAYTVVSCESHAISISKFALGISKILMVVMSIHVIFKS